MIEIDVDDVQLQSIIDNFSKIDFTQPIHAVAVLLEGAIADQFTSSGAYFQKGQTWSPLKINTIKDRTRLGFDTNSILRRHAGDAGLLGSFTSSVIGPQITLSNNKYYAPYLHFGTKFMPPRIIFPDFEKYGMPPDLLEDIQDIFNSYLENF